MLNNLEEKPLLDSTLATEKSLDYETGHLLRIEPDSLPSIAFHIAAFPDSNFPSRIKRVRF